MSGRKPVSDYVLRNISEGISHDSFPATVLLADMRGFTRLTDEAVRRLDWGAEWISDILSTTLSPFIEFVEKEGGFVAEFEGDASMAVFPGERPGLLLQAQKLLDNISYEVGQNISFSVAAGSGQFNWGVSGSEGLLYQLFYGPAVSDAYRVQHNLSDSVIWKETDLKTSRFSCAGLNNDAFSGEFRTVFTAFLALEVSNVEEAQVFFESVCQLSSVLNGFLNGTHLRGNTASAMVVFGALKALESDARRCGEMVTGLKDLFPALRSGVTAGTAFSGFVGSNTRSDFTVLGSTVNLASRFCDRAGEGEILVNSDYRELVNHCFTVRKGEPLKLNGFSEPCSSFSIHDSMPPEEPSTGFQTCRFVGREIEKKYLNELFDSSVEQNRLVTANILGEPGIGKSRLLSEIVSDVSPDVFTLVLRGDDLMTSISLHPWREAIRKLPLRTIEDLAKNPHNSQLSTELKWAEPYLDKLSDDSSISALFHGNTVYSISVFLKSIVESGKFLIGIENPAYMDPESLQILKSFLEGIESAQGMLVTTSRLQSQIPEFLLGAFSITPEPFSIKETVDKLSTDTGFSVRDDVAELLHLRSAGNPLYLEELSRMVQQDQLMGTWSTWQNMQKLLPPTLGSLLESRIDLLSSSMREAVNAASVLGAVFEPEILRHMLSVNSRAITRGLSIGIWKLSERRKLAFRHHLLRETSYRMLLESTRKSIHRRAAEVILELHPEPEGEHLVSLAMHAAKADYSEIATKYLETAGDSCRFAHQNQLAIDIYTELERFADNPDTGMRARGKKAAVMEVLGRWQEALGIYRASVEVADKDSDMLQHSARMRISMGRLLMQQGQFEEALGSLKKAEELLSEDQEMLFAAVYANMGATWLRMEEYGKAAFYLDKWKQIVEAAGDKHSLAMAMGTLGALAEQTGKTEEAIDYYHKQTELAIETDQLLLEGISYHNLGNLALFSGDLVRAEEYISKDLAITRKLGYRREESIATGSLSRVLCLKGEFEEALELAQFFLKVSRVLGNTYRELSALSDVFVVQLYSGSFHEAEQTLRQRLSLAESMSLKESVSESTFSLGLLEMFKGNYEASLAFMERALKYASESGLKPGVLNFSLAGILYWLTGETRSAKSCLKKAEDMSVETDFKQADTLGKLVSLAVGHSDIILAKKISSIVNNSFPEFR